MKAGLPDMEGTRFVSCATVRPVVCPLCLSDEAAVLAEDISLTAQMSNENVSDRVTLADQNCFALH
jgi:hypothetical protein